MKLAVKSSGRAMVDPIPNTTTLVKVISGGEIGVEIAAVRAAKKVGFMTGGIAIEGYLTREGKKPGLFWQYKIRDECRDIRERVHSNILTSDATIRIGKNFGTAEEYNTLRAIRYLDKSHLDIYLEDDTTLPPHVTAEWIISKKIKTLNVTGSCDKAIESTAETYLMEVFNYILWE